MVTGSTHTKIIFSQNAIPILCFTRLLLGSRYTPIASTRIILGSTEEELSLARYPFTYVIERVHFCGEQLAQGRLLN